MRHSSNTTTVQLPNDETITSTTIGNLPIPELSEKAQTTAIFPALTNSSLISIGQLCDDECTAVMNKSNIRIIKDNKIILQGSHNKFDGLRVYH